MKQYYHASQPKEVEACANCRHYVRHYMRGVEKQFQPLECGHCQQRTLTLCKDYDYCFMFEWKEDGEEGL